jgi:hypothetical protein
MESLRSLRAVGSTLRPVSPTGWKRSRKPLILYNWQNSLTLAQTDHQYFILKKSCLYRYVSQINILTIRTFRGVGSMSRRPGRALAHFKLFQRFFS